MLACAFSRLAVMRMRCSFCIHISQVRRRVRPQGLTGAGGRRTVAGIRLVCLVGEENFTKRVVSLPNAVVKRHNLKITVEYFLLDARKAVKAG